MRIELLGALGLVLMLSSALPAQTPVAEPEVTVSFREIPIEEALRQVGAQAGRKVRIDAPGLTGQVTLGVRDLPLSKALKLVLESAGARLEFWEEDEDIVVAPVGRARQRPELALQAGHTLTPFSVAISPDGKYVASAGFDRTARLWSILTGREVRLFGGRTNVLTQIAFSPDGKTLAGACWDMAIHLWDVATGRELTPLTGPQNWCVSVAFSPDGKTLAGGSADRTVRLWDLASGQERRTVKGLDKFPSALAFSPDGKTLAVGDDDQVPGFGSNFRDGLLKDADGVYRIRLVEVESGRVTGEIPAHRERIVGLAWDPKGERIVSASAAPLARVWNVATRKTSVTISGLDDIAGMALSPDGKTLYLAGEGQPIAAYDVATGRPRFTVPDSLRLPAQALAVSRDGRHAATASGGNVRVWDLENRAAMHVGVSRAAAIRKILFSRDGLRLLTLSDSGPRFWDMTTQKPVAGPSLPYISPDAAFLPEGRLIDFIPGIATSNSFRPASVGIVDPATGVRKSGFRPYPSLDSIDGARQATRGKFSQDGARLAVSGAEGGIRVYETASGKMLWERLAGNGAPRQVATLSFDAVGQSLACVGDGRIFLYDAASGTPQRGIAAPPGLNPTALAFSPEGRYLALSGFGAQEVRFVNGRRVTDPKPSLALLDRDTGRVLGTWKELSLGADQVAFRGDGKLLAVSGSSGSVGKLGQDQERRMLVIDTERRELVRNFLLPDSAVSLAFTPDGRFLATAGFEKSVRFWDAATLDTAEAERVTLIPIYPNGYLWTTPYGSYMASKDAVKAVAFRVNEGIFPFEQFDLLLNRPDVILKTLGYAPPSLVEEQYRLYLARLKRLKVDPDRLLRQYHLPEVRLRENELKASVSQPEFTFTVEARDSLYTLDRLEVAVNNVPVFGREGLSLREKKTQAATVPVTLTLARGRNLVTVSVLNERGVESLREAFEVFYNAPAEKPTLFVVTVGVSRYANAQLQTLPYAAKDARDVVEAFQKAKRRFERVETLTLLDEEATKEAVKAKTIAFLKQARPDDTVVVFFAGHGLLDRESEYYFGTNGIVKEDPAKGGLSYAEIEDLLYAAPARRKLLLMDTCHSGEVDALPGAAARQVAAGQEPGVAVGVTLRGSVSLPRGRTTELLQEIFADLRRGSGAVVISAAGGYEAAQERQALQNGAFTSALLEALREPAKADTDKDGKLLVSELRAYVVGRVLALTNNQQKPTSRAENLELDFAIDP